MMRGRVIRSQLPCFARAVVKVGPGEHHVTDAADTAISTILGSCVAACIRDPVAQVGGLNHFMLPQSRDGVWGKASASLRYGNFAMERLINDILARGGHRSRLEIKLFGGARLGRDHAAIGTRNADYAEAYLRDEGMVPLVRQLRGTRARLVVYVPATGRSFMRELPGEGVRLAAAERRFGRTVPACTGAGTIELFHQAGEV
ncbi:chemotaxis protein [Muricoccus vinaceus]|uniref:Probable chemoreceptor glutamine deamidase CheD n=1 Tax=Muricoccus vinaceus TaxID=424704 RepID=A0ABV6IM89_9PROT